MKRLSRKFSKYGHQFEQLCRTERTAIYLMHINGRQKSWEVIVIRVCDKKPDKSTAKLRFVACEPYESYPTSEKWGLTGWTYTTEEDARKKYDLLNGSKIAPSLPSKRRRATDGILQERVSLSQHPFLSKRKEIALCEIP